VAVHSSTIELWKVGNSDQQGISQVLPSTIFFNLLMLLLTRPSDSCIHFVEFSRKSRSLLGKFSKKSVNRCVPRIMLRPAEKESWSTIQICAAGKGLLCPWGWNGCRNAEAGKRSIRKDWPPPFLTHCDRGKPQGCLEPAEAVLKGKPHAFESWSGHLSFFNSLQFSPHSLRCCRACRI
jgi:hypothetical protein